MEDSGDITFDFMGNEANENKEATDIYAVQCAIVFNGGCNDLIKEAMSDSLVGQKIVKVWNETESGGESPPQISPSEFVNTHLKNSAKGLKSAD